MGSGRDKTFHVVNSCYKETIVEVNSVDAYGTSWPISVPTLVAVLECSKRAVELRGGRAGVGGGEGLNRGVLIWVDGGGSLNRLTISSSKVVG